MSSRFALTFRFPFKPKLLSINAIVLLVLIFSGFAFAGEDQVTLAWDYNSESALAGYKLYYKVGSSGALYDGSGLDQGDSPIVIPLASLSDCNNPEFTLTGLVAGEPFHFVITAYSSDGYESLFSNEVSLPETGLGQDPPIRSSSAGYSEASESAFLQDMKPRPFRDCQ